MSTKKLVSMGYSKQQSMLRMPSSDGGRICPPQADREFMQEVELLRGIDDEEAVGLCGLGDDLGKMLHPRHANGNRQT